MGWFSDFFDPVGIPAKPNKGYIEQTDLNGKPKTKYILPKVIQDIKTIEPVEPTQYIKPNTKVNPILASEDLSKAAQALEVTVTAPRLTLKPTLTPEERKVGLEKAFNPGPVKPTRQLFKYDKTKDEKFTKNIQEQLIAAGYTIKLDGKWGEKTQAAFDAWRDSQKAKDANNYLMTAKTAELKKEKPISKLATSWIPSDKSGGKIDKSKEKVKNYIEEWNKQK